MTNFSGLPSSFGNSLNPGFLSKGVSAEFHGAPGDSRSAVKDSSSSFMDGLGSILGKTVSGGLALASLGSAIALPGISFGLSKMGDATASSLLTGLLSSNTSGASSSELSSLAGMTASAGQMVPRNPYQVQSASLPGAQFTTSA
jgi:hypothetical protein